MARNEYAIEYQRRLRAAQAEVLEPARPTSTPAVVDQDLVALRRELLIAHPEMDRAQLDRAVSAVRIDALRADLAAEMSNLESDWRSVRAAEDAEADALLARIKAAQATPVSDAEKAAAAEKSHAEWLASFGVGAAVDSDD